MKKTRGSSEQGSGRRAITGGGNVGLSRSEAGGAGNKEGISRADAPGGAEHLKKTPSAKKAMDDGRVVPTSLRNLRSGRND